MSRTSYGNLTGRAAATQAAELRAELRDDEERRYKEAHQHCNEVCSQIMQLVGEQGFAAWIETTPDTNTEFLAAAELELEKITRLLIPQEGGKPIPGEYHVKI